MFLRNNTKQEKSASSNFTKTIIVLWASEIHLTAQLGDVDIAGLLSCEVSESLLSISSADRLQP